MPKSVPPPPPQPSAEETVHAVRLSRILAAVAILLFLGVASTYRNSAPMVAYGRENGASWNLRKARLLDEDEIRSHEGGKIAWLVGSSILREAFHEKAINQALRQLQSPWRVVKFGQTRGASGLSSGMLSRLPIQEGDLVIHSLAVENFRRDWITFTDLPDYRLMLLMDSAGIWEIGEWAPSQKLEVLSGFPRNFYRYQDEAMDGWFRWLNAPFRGKRPRKRRKSFHTRFKSLKTHKKLELVRDKGLLSRNVLRAEELDLSGGQFNMQGLQRMRAHCAGLGVELVLIDVPQRQEYREIFLLEGVWERWAAWMAAQPELIHFPQPPDVDFYDMKHPNSRGRLQLSTHLVRWLDDRDFDDSDNVIEGGNHRDL